MRHITIKAAVSGFRIARIPDIARHYPGSFARIRSGFGFWTSLLVGCLLTVALYFGMIWLAGRFGLKL